MTAPTRDRTETRARRRWTTFVVGIFVSQAALWIFAITLVASDTSHAIVSNYDERALKWDDHVDKQRHSMALGWSASVALEGGAAENGRVLVVTLTDADARPISDADVEVTLFHQARAAERTRLLLRPDGHGSYAAVASMTRPGKWRLELRARRGMDELILDETHAIEHEE
jgi:nitrogen fixation protein FixH